MRGGRLRKRLEYWVKRATRDAEGDQVENWVLEATCWGALEPLAGRELEAAGKEHGQLTHRIVIRVGAISKPQPQDQIRYQGRVFDLDPPQDVDERGRQWIIPARELLVP